MKHTLQPLTDHVIVRRDESEQTTPGGILLPDVAKKKPVRGEVLAVGPGKIDDNGNLQPVNVKAGQVVLFTRYAGTEVELDGDEVLILIEGDILAIIPG